MDEVHLLMYGEQVLGVFALWSDAYERAKHLELSEEYEEGELYVDSWEVE